MSDIKRVALPTDEQMLKLKRELNFLLWTTDVPEVPKDFPIAVKFCGIPEQAKINVQCVSHTVITAAIFMQLGYAVTTRAGMAFVLDLSADGNSDNDMLNQIGKHWWLSLDGYGLVDLSLNAETEHPLIYCNHSIGGRWQVSFGESREKLDAFLNTRQRGCFYLTFNKRQTSHEALVQSLAQPFEPAKPYGFFVPYANIARHGEGLLLGSAKSLAEMTQQEAWKRLAEP